MALTGTLFLLWVLAHMYGNLKVFGGKEAFDTYAAGLREIGEPLLPYAGFLWVMRVVLLASLVIHVWAAVVLTSRAWRARGVKPTKRLAVEATWSSRTMRWGGVAILAFVIFHVLQFTTRTIEVGGSFDSPYERMVAAFDIWYIVLIYTVAMLALGMHLRHGVWSAAQTMGWSNRYRRAGINFAGWVVAIVVAGGFLTAPLAILFGIIT